MSWSRCQPSDLVTIPFGTDGARITVQKRAVPAFMMLAMVMAAHNYRIRPGDTGAYNCRYIDGTLVWSNHAYAIAVDVNWQSNPYSSILITDMPPAMIRDIEDIKTVDGIQVFRWGGRYSGSKDAMHFEIMVTPEQLARGLRGGTSNMPLNAADLNDIRTIVQNNVDSAINVIKKEADDTNKAILDYLDAMARELGANPTNIWNKLKLTTKSILNRVK
jgi:hypothetical protein